MKPRARTTLCSWSAPRSGIIAQNIAAGDFRSAAGARWYNDMFWARRLRDRPDHRCHSLRLERHAERHHRTDTARSPALRRRSSAATTTRVHLGGDAEWLIQPPRNLVTNAQTLTLSDRPELRHRSDHADLDRRDCRCVRRAGLQRRSRRHLWAALCCRVNTSGSTSIAAQQPRCRSSSLKFQGGYAQAAYVADRRNPQVQSGDAASMAASCRSIRSRSTAAAGAPGKSPVALSTIDLNDQLGDRHRHRRRPAAVYTLALNWYVNRNVRFMFDYLHGDVAEAGQPDQLHRRRLEVRCVRDADAGGVLMLSLPGAARSAPGDLSTLRASAS